MSHMSDALAEMYRTQKHIKPVRTNKFTRSRVRQYEAIKEQTGQDPTNELDFSIQLVKENIPQVQRYVLSQNESPASNTNDLIVQAYRLRCQQINDVSTSMDIPPDEAEIWLEMDESEDATLETASSDTYLGALFAAIGVAATRLEQRNKKGLAYDPSYSMSEKPDNLDPNLVTGLLNTVGQKIGSADLRRAAQNKPAGVLGALGTGGTSHYDALRAYFQKNPSVAQQVLSGQITDESQLPNWSSGLPTGANVINSNDLTSGIAAFQAQQQIKKYLPIVLIVIALIVVIILVARKK